MNTDSNKRNRECPVSSRERTLYDLSRLRRNGAVLPVDPPYNSPAYELTDQYMTNHQYVDSIHQDIAVSHFHDGDGIGLPYGLTTGCHN